MPPALTAIDSGLALVGGLAAGAVECEDAFDAVRTGEICAIAEPGRGGKFLLATLLAALLPALALFCASIASRRLDLLPVVLFDKLLAGRAVSVFLGEFGLLGSLTKSFCAVASKSVIILRPVSIGVLSTSEFVTYASARACQIPQYAQYVDLDFSLTPGFASLRPFLIHFSIRSTPPVCSI